MPDFYEQPNKNIFSLTCDVASGKFEPYIKSEEAEHVQSSCNNPTRQNMPTCKDPELSIFLKEISGLVLDLPLSSVKNKLPSYIPILDKRTALLPFNTIPTDTVGFTLLDTLQKGVIFKHGAWHEQDDISFRVKLLLGGAVRGKRAILLSSGSDTLIEWLWYRRDDCSLFRHLRAMGFSLMTGINFSEIKGECRCGQCINQKKSLLSAYLAEQCGIPSVLHIYATDQYDVDRWVKYLKTYPQIELVSMNCQLQKSKEDRNTVVTSILKILESVNRPINIILTGFPLKEIERFGPYLKQIHFADTVPSKYAQSHRKIQIDHKTLSMRDGYVDEPIHEILTHNINQRHLYLEIVKQKTLKKYTFPLEIENLLQSYPLLWNAVYTRK